VTAPPIFGGEQASAFARYGSLSANDIPILALWDTRQLGLVRQQAPYPSARAAQEHPHSSMM